MWDSKNDAYLLSPTPAESGANLPRMDTNTDPKRPAKNTVELTCFAPETEYSKLFLRGMLNRISVSHQKYGFIADHFPDNTDALACARAQVEAYQRTGNTEHLIDAANYLMFEFIHPAVPDAFFKPTDSKGSIGIVRKDGTVEGRGEDAQ